MTENQITTNDQGLQNEIDTLRSLILSLSKNEAKEPLLMQRIHQLNAVGRNELILARLLQIQKSLLTEKDNPAELLRQSLLELENEWPEFKKMVERYPSAHPRTDTNSLQ